MRTLRLTKNLPTLSSITSPLYVPNVSLHSSFANANSLLEIDSSSEEKKQERIGKPAIELRGRQQIRILKCR